MPRGKDQFDVDGWLAEAEEPVARPIHERYQPVPIRPHGSPQYLASFIEGASEFPVTGSTVPGYKFTCPACGGNASVTYGFPPEGPFNIVCEGRCKPGELRRELEQRAPLAFELRDDIVYAMPAALRDEVVAAAGEGASLQYDKDLHAILRSMRRKSQRIAVHEYTGPDGQPVLLILRQDLEGGGKAFLPVHCYVDVSGAVRLDWHHPAGLLPLYNWHGLASEPDKTVLVVEGEKTALLAQTRFPGLVVITSPSGANNASLADWGLLHGRHVVVWPDNDPAGHLYANEVAAYALQAGALSVRRVALPKLLGPKWDLADAPPEGLTEADLADAIERAAEVKWAEVKDCLAARGTAALQPPFRLPDGHFERHKVMRDALEGALQVLDPGCTRGPWLRVLGAAYHAFGESAFDLVDGWSRRDADKHRKYVEGEVRRLYDRFAAAPHPKPPSLLAVFRMAMKASRNGEGGKPAWCPSDAAMALAHVAEFEATHRKVTQGDNVMIGVQVQLPNGRYEVRRIRESSADSVYLSRKAPDFQGSRTSIFRLYQHHQLVPPVELVFKPAGDVLPGEHNLFQGFDIQPEAGLGTCELFKKHIAYIAEANGDDPGYLWKLLAFRMQNPGTFVPCALVLIGPEGGGKSTVTSALAKLTAPYSLTLSDPEKFVGRNNACLEGKLFVQLEEMILGPNENYDSRLKHYVTSETLDVEEKYRAQWVTPNHLFIALTANKKSVVRITEHSRRFAVYDVPDRFKGDQVKREKFFSALWEELNCGGLEALAHELKNVDLEGFSPAQVPKTPLFLELAGVDADRDPLRRWWHDFLERGRSSFDGVKDSEWTAPIRKELLYMDYAGWCDRNGTEAKRSVVSKAEWAKGLGRMLPGGLQPKRMMKEGKRDHFIILPEYEACCTYFEAMFNCTLDLAPEPGQLRSVI